MKRIDEMLGKVAQMKLSEKEEIALIITLLTIASFLQTQRRQVPKQAADVAGCFAEPVGVLLSQDNNGFGG